MDIGDPESEGVAPVNRIVANEAEKIVTANFCNRIPIDPSSQLGGIESVTVITHTRHGNRSGRLIFRAWILGESDILPGASMRSRKKIPDAVFRGGVRLLPAFALAACDVEAHGQFGSDMADGNKRALWQMATISMTGSCSFTR